MKERRNAIERLKALTHIYGVTLRDLRRLRALNRSAERQDDRILEITNDWSRNIFEIIGLQLQVTGAPIERGPCLFVSNHLGYVDIPLLLSVAHAAFVSKKQIRHWPFFGAGAEAIGTLFVDRDSMSSRQRIAGAIGQYVAHEGRRLVLFPEGTSSLEGKAWKRGAFVIARNFGFKVQALRLHYQPLRELAYIDRDSFLPHLWRLLGEKRIDASIEASEPRHIKDAEKDMSQLEEWVRSSFKRKQASLDSKANSNRVLAGS